MLATPGIRVQLAYFAAVTQTCNHHDTIGPHHNTVDSLYKVNKPYSHPNMTCQSLDCGVATRAFEPNLCIA